MRKRILSFLLVLVLTSALLVPAVSVSASSYTAPAPVYPSEVRSRLDELAGMLKGKYFTTTGYTCNASGSSYHGCEKCDIMNVVKNGPFRTYVNGFVPSVDLTVLSANGGMKHWFGVNSSWTLGKSCCGFANFAGWYLFAQKTSDLVVFKAVNGSVAEFNHENIARYCRPGDLLRMGKSPAKGTHSVVFMEELEDRSGIRVLDCNWNYGEAGNCQITVHNILYSSAYTHFGSARAENLADCPGHVFENGRCIYCGEPAPCTEHEYRLGRCIRCGATAPYVTDCLNACTETVPTHISVRINASSGLKFRTVPSGEAFSEEIGILPDATVTETAKILKNAAGEYWYEISRSGYTGYISCAFTVPVEVCKDIETPGFVQPGTLSQGSGFWLEGRVTSGSVITDVTASVYAGSGTVSGTPVLSSAATDIPANCLSYDLKNSTVDSGLHFGRLSYGKYTFLLTASCKAAYSDDGKNLRELVRDSVPLRKTVFSVIDPSLKFTDVQPDAWYYSDVSYCSRNGLMSGTGDGSVFSPQETCTRAMVVSVLYRLSGSPAVRYVSRFPDVAAGEWYSAAVIWAAGAGVVSGYDTGCFGPSDSVTREQLTLLLKNYAEKVRMKTCPSFGNLTVFPDASSVSVWAQGAVSWAVGEGLISGKANDGMTVLDPSGTCSRAELASILARFGRMVS